MRWMLILALVACGAESSSEDTSEAAPIVPDKDAIAKVTENGPVKAKVLVWPAKPSLSDPIYVRLEVEAPVGVSIDAPFQEAGDQRLGRFRVVGFARDQQRTADAEPTYAQALNILDTAGGSRRQANPQLPELLRVYVRSLRAGGREAEEAELEARAEH